MAITVVKEDDWSESLPQVAAIIATALGERQQRPKQELDDFIAKVQTTGEIPSEEAYKKLYPSLAGSLEYTDAVNMANRIKAFFDARLARISAETGYIEKQAQYYEEQIETGRMHAKASIKQAEAAGDSVKASYFSAILGSLNNLYAFMHKEEMSELDRGHAKELALLNARLNIKLSELDTALRLAALTNGREGGDRTLGTLKEIGAVLGSVNELSKLLENASGRVRKALEDKIYKITEASSAVLAEMTGLPREGVKKAAQAGDLPNFVSKSIPWLPLPSDNDAARPPDSRLPSPRTRGIVPPDWPSGHTRPADTQPPVASTTVNPSPLVPSHSSVRPSLPQAGRQLLPPHEVFGTFYEGLRRELNNTLFPGGQQSQKRQQPQLSPVDLAAFFQAARQQEGEANDPDDVYNNFLTQYLSLLSTFRR